MTLKVCTGCARQLPSEKFYAARFAQCIECCRGVNRKRARARRERIGIEGRRTERLKFKTDSPEKFQENMRHGRARRKARKLGIFYQAIDREHVWDRDKGMCGVCHLHADHDDWHLDHVIPLNLRGPHTYINVQVLHPLCNLQKSKIELPENLPMMSALQIVLNLSNSDLAKAVAQAAEHGQQIEQWARDAVLDALSGREHRPHRTDAYVPPPILPLVRAAVIQMPRVKSDADVRRERILSLFAVRISKPMRGLSLLRG